MQQCRSGIPPHSLAAHPRALYMPCAMNASALQLARQAPNPVQALMGMADGDMRAVDGIILDRMRSSVGLIPDLANHLVGAGGKRIRPLLTVACAAMVGYRGEGHHKLAAAVEFIHSATLLHDDVVDQSALRRGRKPANLVWGNAPSILVGDFLFARAFGLMVETGSMEALGILARASSVIAEGEVQQLASLRDIAVSEASYTAVIAAKTAELFASACEVAPVLAGRPGAERAALRTYGRSLGLAFQLVDDALDYGGLASALGKSVGDDFREGKVTLPVILAVGDGSATKDSERAFWHRVIVDLDQTDVDLERAVSLLRRRGALRATLARAQEYADAAVDALRVFPESEWRGALESLAGYVVARTS